MRSVINPNLDSEAGINDEDQVNTTAVHAKGPRTTEFQQQQQQQQQHAGNMGPSHQGQRGTQLQYPIVLQLPL